MTTNLDAIVVGSGPAGATVARELTRRNRRVLLLERGGNAPLGQGLLATASILDTLRVGEKLITTRAFTTGGTSAVYFGVANDPPVEILRSLGVDLSQQFAEARQELPIAALPDAMLSAQSVRLRDSAQSLGLSWDKNPMLIDQDKCPDGFTAAARWNARSYVNEAVANSATLISKAQVLRVLIEDNKAVGVEYKLQNGTKNGEIRRAFADRVILSAGGSVSPVILRNSGLRNVAKDGFYIHPCFAVFGTVPGMKAGENFVGNAETRIGNINIGDGNFDSSFYRMFMLGGRRFLRAFLHSRSIGVGVMVKERPSGELREDGRYHKELAAEDYRQLEKGEELARRIVMNAGGKNLYRSPLSASHVGGSMRINEHVDDTLQTETRNLHVCDGSVVPETYMGAPTLTLICLGKYLAGRLASSH